LKCGPSTQGDLRGIRRRNQWTRQTDLFPLQNLFHGRPHKCQRTTSSPEKPIPKNSTFYVRHPADKFGSRVTSLGRGLKQAFLQYRQFEVMAQSKEDRLLLLESPDGEESAERVLITDAVARHLAKLTAGGLSVASRAAHESALEGFRASCRKTFVDEIVRDDVVLYLSQMKQNSRQSRSGQRNITIGRRLALLNIFLGQYEKTKFLSRKEWPTAAKTKPTVYTQEKWSAIMDATIARKADADALIARKAEERIRLAFFRFTACLNMEVAAAEYSDIDAKTCLFHIKTKPHLNWQPKRSVEREIVLPAEFVKCLLARRDAKNSSRLLFPNAAGNIDHNLIGFLKSAAKRARIAEHVTLHKIRRTTAFEYAARFGIGNCLKLLGCNSVAMTTRYDDAEDMTSPDRRKDMEEFFSRLVAR
jgi:Phage integrase family